MIEPAVSLRLERGDQLRGDRAERDNHASMAAPLRCSTVLPASPPPSTRSAASVSTP
jgi:hypothetical protein